MLVTHSIPYGGGINYWQTALREWKIRPHRFRKKIGLSFQGCYPRVCNHTTSYAVLIFDLENIKEYVKPTIYMPLKRYCWYFDDAFCITWCNLVWETELCCFTEIPLDLARGVYISKRAKVKRRQAEEAGLRVYDSIPKAPLQKWALRIARNTPRMIRYKESIDYNLRISKIFELDYEEIEKNLPELIEKREVQRLGRTCRTCVYHKWDWDLNSPPRFLCLLTKKETSLDDTCDKWLFNIGLHLDNY